MHWVLIASMLLASTGAGPMHLRSKDFAAGATLPRALMANDCGGQNRSPQLSWSASPAGTKSFALIVHDPDAPHPGGFYHWVVYNLPATTHELASNERLLPSQLGKTSADTNGYYGPCPPPGPIHHYVFTLYALDVAQIAADAPLSAAELIQRISGHILARVVLTGTESRH